ncbi:GNAT family N-acetyltransferase [Paenibacillus silviterrae]|uniref:GNAT family N-acetyltransferase n=1 Tax=Paenibacillus silviterrae TaxID=3242194 RepID=UPI002542EABE|nr:GNAT family N-acetyltransferase [Paenibacillus chinjuensis]
MEIRFDAYVISDEKAKLKVETILGFLARSYWADKRVEAAIRRSIETSHCYGVYEGEKQIGFARVVTDYATMYYLCDVYVDEAYRGQGIGKRLVDAIVNSEELKGLSGLLGTRDAHGLYEQYGFAREPEKMMRKRPVG